MSPGDTTPAAAAAQMAILRRKTGAERVQLACELSDLVRELALAGLRDRNPGLSQPEILRLLLRQTYRPEELPPDLR